MSEYAFKSCYVKDIIHTYTITKQWRDKYLVNKCLSLIADHINAVTGLRIPQITLNQLLLQAKDADNKHITSAPLENPNHSMYGIEVSFSTNLAEENIIITLVELDESVELVELS